MPDRMMNLEYEQLRPLLVQYLKSASSTLASHAEGIEKLTADVHLHDDDLKQCAEKMAEVVDSVNELKATKGRGATSRERRQDCLKSSSSLRLPSKNRRKFTSKSDHHGPELLHARISFA
jgi:uncharacterized protein YoxC